MATITTLAITDNGSVSRTTINDNFTNLNTDKIEAASTDTLTNKTIDGDNNTISNLAHGAEVDNPTSGVHGATGTIVGTSDAQTLTNKTLTTPIIAQISNTGTLTLPTSTDTLVGRDTTDTLTNKTITVAANTLDSASTTAQGVIEIATIAETDAGTDATRAVSPDGLHGSTRNIRWLAFPLYAATTDVATGTNVFGDFECPVAGTILQSDTTPFYLYANNSTAGTTGTMVVDININGTSIMTTNKLDFDTGEKTTTTASTPPDLTTTTVAVGDLITFDVDSVHTTAAKGLIVYMAIRED